jgi:hypothetical protein
MRSNPKSANRKALLSASHAKSYDPSEYYRAMMMPPPPPVTAKVPSYNPYSSNPNMSRDVPATNVDPRTGALKRIPQYYYPRYDDADDPSSRQPYLPPRAVEQPVSNEVHPYSQPMPSSMNPYAPGQQYPYSTPYVIPLTLNIPSGDPALNAQEQSKADLIAAHQKDADLSRLEVYHFTPKQNTSPSMGTAGHPIIQYHVYPTPPAPGALPPPISSQQPHQKFPSYPYPWYGYPPNASSYAPEPYQQEFPYTETTARGSQTEQPSTKNRGVSPMRLSSAAPIYDDEGYPYIHQRKVHTDQHDITTGRINQRFYDSNRSPPLPDCRCLDCQQERTKVLNYYPD